MLTWLEFAEARPDLAENGKAMFYQFSVGLGFLGTVRRDGGRRIHAMCPIITDDGLFAFIVPGPKRDDLIRDGRYAMHGFPQENNEDAFYITGNAELQDDAFLRERVARVFFDERKWEAPPPGFDDQRLFEFFIDSCLVTRTTGHGDHDPQHTVWRAEPHTL